MASKFYFIILMPYHLNNIFVGRRCVFEERVFLDGRDKEFIESGETCIESA